MCCCCVEKRETLSFTLYKGLAKSSLQEPTFVHIMKILPTFLQCLLLVLATSHAQPERRQLHATAPKKDCPCGDELLPRPDLERKAKTARWMVHTLNWGVLSTISSRLPDNVPFGNVYSFVDGPCNSSTGIPYFYGTFMDQTFKDMKQHPQASFTLSENSLASVCGAEALSYCQTTVPPTSHAWRGDPESPLCARLTLTGTLVPVDTDSIEYQHALSALLTRHPQMKDWPTDHNWIIAKLELQDVWLIDYFGGATIIPVQEYLQENLYLMDDI